MKLVYIISGLMLLWVFVIAIVGRLEKRMVWPYGELQDSPPFDDPVNYGARWVGEARSMGFTFLGWAPDLKGAAYKVSYGFLVSPERDCLVIVGVGTVLNMKLRGTWIYTVSADGRVLYSTDNQACITIDVSRQWKTQLLRSASFTGLLEGHRDLVRILGFVPRVFRTGHELTDFKQLREEHYQSMARSGFIKFIDAAGTRWHYTTFGALKLSCLNYFIGLLRGITDGKTPRAA